MGDPASHTPADAESDDEFDPTLVDDSEVEYSSASEAEDEPPPRRRRTKDRRDDETHLVANEEDLEEARRSARRYQVAVFALLAVAGLMTLAAAVRFWLPSWAPLLAFAVLGVGPLLFWACVGALIFDPTKTREGLVGKDSPPLAHRLKLALVPVIGAAVMGSAIASLWFIPSVRVVMAKISANQRLSATLDSALRDENADVRLAACEGLTELKDDTSTQLLSALIDSSDAVVDCALDALPSQPVAAPQLASAVLKWQRELSDTPDGAQTGERACLLSNRIRVSERKGVGRVSMQLMMCALDAKSGPARECCAQSFRATLGGNEVDPPMVMPPASELVHNGFYNAVPSLLKATHSPDPVWEKKRQALRLDTPGSRAWAMSIGCESLSMGGAQLREPISAAMATAVSSDSCRIGPAQETTVRLWNAVCSELFTAQNVASADGSESDKFCTAINGTLVADATNGARQITQDALRAARQPNRQKQMMRMLLDYSGRMAKAMGDGSAPAPGPGRMFGGAGTETQTSMFGEMMKMFGDAGGTMMGDDDAPASPANDMFNLFLDPGKAPKPGTFR